MSIIITIFVAFFSFQSIAWEDHHLINGCKIFSMTGKNLRTFPGSICLFSDDGTLISASDTHIRLITPDNNIKWEIPGKFHHQMNFSLDKKRILTLDSKIIETSEGLRRSDYVVVIDAQTGRKLYDVGIEKILTEAKVKFENIILSPEQRKKFGIDREISHFNSIYEIPEIMNKNVPPFIKEGNIVINGIHSGIFILSKDLKEVIYHTTFPQSFFHWVHDVQVKSNGNFIFFNNVNSIPGKKYQGRLLQSNEIEKYYSTIVEITPNKLKTVFEFGAKPKGMFFSIVSAGVQEYGDLIIFSHYLSGAYIYSKKQKDLIATVPGTNADEMRIIPAQQVKAQNLKKFLDLWK